MTYREYLKALSSIASRLIKNYLFLTIVASSLAVLARFLIYSYPNSLYLSGADLSLGKLRTVLRVVPAILSLVGLVMIFAKAHSTKKVVVTLVVLALFYTVLVPFGVLLHDSTPGVGSDGLSYVRIARYMVDNRTLKLERAPFWMQPGYSYFLAANCLLPGYPIFLYTLLHSYVLVILVIVSLNGILHSKLESGKLAFALLSYPIVCVSSFFIKNCFSGLTEWLVFGFLFFSLYFRIKKAPFFCVILLSLVSFIRQNLLVTTGLLTAIVALEYWDDKKKIAVGLILVWLLIFMLPLMHNLYYAGVFDFLAANREVSVRMKPIYHVLYDYLGYPYLFERFKVERLCVPFGSIVFLIFLVRLFRAGTAGVVLYLLLMVSCVGPTAIFGWAYYPRFQLVNYAILFVGYYYIVLVREISRGFHEKKGSTFLKQTAVTIKPLTASLRSETRWTISRGTGGRIERNRQ